MTHRERVLATLRFDPTDRPPYDLMEGCVWPELMDYFRDEHSLADAPAVLDYLDTDFRWVGMEREPSAAPEPDADDAPDPEQPLPDAAKLYSKKIADGPLAGARTIADVEAHEWPDLSVCQPRDYAADRLIWPDHALVFVGGWTPLFWHACEAFGVETAMVNLATRPELFECAVKCIHERYMGLLRSGLGAARGHVDICWLGDDFSTQESMFLSPDHWRRFIRPYLAEQVEFARGQGMLVLYHSCGALRPVIGDLIDIGVNCLEVFQTTARGMDAVSIAREFGGRLAFYGGMDIQGLLSYGTTTDVRAEVAANVRAFGERGGYVVANSHHNVATIDGRNVEAMCAAARSVATSAG
jgi:uroporphyrinogen decarboxylase